MKKTVLFGLLSVSGFAIALASSLSNNSVSNSLLALYPADNSHSYTFTSSDITNFDPMKDYTYDGSLVLKKTLDTCEDTLDVYVDYYSDGPCTAKDSGHIFTYNMDYNDADFEIMILLTNDVKSGVSVTLNGTFTDILDEVAYSLTFTESDSEIEKDGGSGEYTIDIVGGVYTNVVLDSIVISYTC